MDWKLKRLFCCSIVTLARRYSTIYALSSGFTKCGVAVVRISGNRANQVHENMIKLKEPPKARMAYLKTIYDPQTDEPLDRGLYLWFPGPKSFTGEDVCELQVHGSKAVILAVLSALSKLPDFRPAEPGEFTKRAFYANKYDLTEIEGLSDLIDAETELQRKQALNQMAGSLNKIYSVWREKIVDALSQIEAYIDFGEDQFLDNLTIEAIEQRVYELRNLIHEHLSDGRKGEILRDGIKTVIVGMPNVGKSSLLNLLCRRPAAIVTEIAGTTRDVIHSTLNINGYPVLVSDTAGIRNDGSEDMIEMEGIRRSIGEAKQANLVLLVLDSRRLFENATPDVDFKDIVVSYCQTYQKSLTIDSILSDTDHIVLANKWDLLTSEQQRLLQTYSDDMPNFIPISCKTEFGVPRMLSYMTHRFKHICGQPEQSNPSYTRARHRHHLENCVTSLDTFLELMKSRQDDEEFVVIAAESLRKATRHLGLITGLVTTDEILSNIFQKFCIGK